MGQRLFNSRALVAVLATVAAPLAAFAQGGGSSGHSGSSHRVVKSNYIDPPVLKFRLENCENTFVDQTAILMDHAITPAFYSFDYSPLEFPYSGSPNNPIHHGKPTYRENVIDMISIMGDEISRTYLRFESVGNLLQMADENLESILNGAIVNVEVNKSPGLGVIYRVAEKALYRERMAVQLFKRSQKLTQIFKIVQQNRLEHHPDPYFGLDDTQRAFVESLGTLSDEDVSILAEEIDSSSRIYDGTKDHYRSDPSMPVELMYRLRDMDPWAIRFLRNSFPNRKFYEFGAYKIPRLMKKIPGETPARKQLRLKLVMNQYVQKFVHWAFVYEKYVMPEVERLKDAQVKFEKKTTELTSAETELKNVTSSWAKRKLYSKTIEVLTRNIEILKREKTALSDELNSAAIFIGHFARNADPKLHERELGFQVLQEDPIFMINPMDGKFLTDIHTGERVPQMDPVTGTQTKESISTADALRLAPKLKTLLDTLKTKIKTLDTTLKALEQGRTSAYDPDQLGDTP